MHTNKTYFAEFANQPIPILHYHSIEAPARLIWLHYRRKKQLLTMQINFQKEFRFLHSVGGD